MGYQLLPDSFEPPTPTEDMELTAANVLKLYDELREWHKTKTEHALDKNGNTPSYVLGELAQLRALLSKRTGISVLSYGQAGHSLQKNLSQKRVTIRNTAAHTARGQLTCAWVFRTPTEAL
jgi:hypothetical protein